MHHKNEGKEEITGRSQETKNEIESSVKTVLDSKVFNLIEKMSQHQLNVSNDYKMVKSNFLLLRQNLSTLLNKFNPIMADFLKLVDSLSSSNLPLNIDNIEEIVKLHKILTNTIRRLDICTNDAHIDHFVNFWSFDFFSALNLPPDFISNLISDIIQKIIHVTELTAKITLESDLENKNVLISSKKILEQSIINSFRILYLYLPKGSLSAKSALAVYPSILTSLEAASAEHVSLFFQLFFEYVDEQRKKGNAKELGKIFLQMLHVSLHNPLTQQKVAQQIVKNFVKPSASFDSSEVSPDSLRTLINDIIHLNKALKFKHQQLNHTLEKFFEIITLPEEVLINLLTESFNHLKAVERLRSANNMRCSLSNKVSQEISLNYRVLINLIFATQKMQSKKSDSSVLGHFIKTEHTSSNLYELILKMIEISLYFPMDIWKGDPVFLSSVHALFRESNILNNTLVENELSPIVNDRKVNIKKAIQMEFSEKEKEEEEIMDSTLHAKIHMLAYVSLFQLENSSSHNLIDTCLNPYTFGMTNILNVIGAFVSANIEEHKLNEWINMVFDKTNLHNNESLKIGMLQILDLTLLPKDIRENSTIHRELEAKIILVRYGLIYLMNHNQSSLINMLNIYLEHRDFKDVSNVEKLLNLIKINTIHKPSPDRLALIEIIVELGVRIGIIEKMDLLSPLNSKAIKEGHAANWRTNTSHKMLAQGIVTLQLILLDQKFLQSSPTLDISGYIQPVLSIGTISEVSHCEKLIGLIEYLLMMSSDKTLIKTAVVELFKKFAIASETPEDKTALFNIIKSSGIVLQNINRENLSLKAYSIFLAQAFALLDPLLEEGKRFGKFADYVYQMLTEEDLDIDRVISLYFDTKFSIEFATEIKMPKNPLSLSENLERFLLKNDAFEYKHVPLNLAYNLPNVGEKIVLNIFSNLRFVEDPSYTYHVNIENFFTTFFNQVDTLGINEFRSLFFVKSVQDTIGLIVNEEFKAAKICLFDNLPDMILGKSAFDLSTDKCAEGSNYLFNQLLLNQLLIFINSKQRQAPRDFLVGCLPRNTKSELLASLLTDGLRGNKVSVCKAILDNANQKEILIYLNHLIQNKLSKNSELLQRVRTGRLINLELIEDILNYLGDRIDIDLPSIWRTINKWIRKDCEKLLESFSIHEIYQQFDQDVKMLQQFFPDFLSPEDNNLVALSKKITELYNTHAHPNPDQSLIFSVSNYRQLLTLFQQFLIELISVFKREIWSDSSLEERRDALYSSLSKLEISSKYYVSLDTFDETKQGIIYLSQRGNKLHYAVTDFNDRVFENELWISDIESNLNLLQKVDLTSAYQNSAVFPVVTKFVLCQIQLKESFTKIPVDDLVRGDFNNIQNIFPSLKLAFLEYADICKTANEERMIKMIDPKMEEANEKVEKKSVEEAEKKSEENSEEKVKEVKVKEKGEKIKIEEKPEERLKEKAEGKIEEKPEENVKEKSEEEIGEKNKKKLKAGLNKKIKARLRRKLEASKKTHGPLTEQIESDSKEKEKPNDSSAPNLLSLLPPVEIAKKTSDAENLMIVVQVIYAKINEVTDWNLSESARDFRMDLKEGGSRKIPLTIHKILSELNTIEEYAVFDAKWCASTRAVLQKVYYLLNDSLNSFDFYFFGLFGRHSDTRQFYNDLRDYLKDPGHNIIPKQTQPRALSTLQFRN